MSEIIIAVGVVIAFGLGAALGYLIAIGRHRYWPGRDNYEVWLPMLHGRAAGYRIFLATFACREWAMEWSDAYLTGAGRAATVAQVDALLDGRSSWHRGGIIIRRDKWRGEQPAGGSTSRSCHRKDDFK